MNRRRFLFAAAAALLAAGTPAVGVAAPFEPSRFSVEVRGSGPDVVLIPGLASGREVWRRSLVPGYRYHLIQVAGFAGEPAGGNRRGAIVAPLADEIARYIDARGLERSAIVGHSMGGTLAMMIGARHPTLAGRIMVVDMLPQPAGLFGGSASDWGPLARSLGGRLLGSLVATFSPPDAAGARSDPDVVGRATHELAGMDLTPMLPRIRVPLTIVYAAPSPESRAAIDRQFAAAYAPARHARLLRVDGAGHMVMLDQPARFRATLAAFLSDRPPGGS